MFTQCACTSHLRMSLVMTTLSQCNKVTQPQQLRYHEAAGSELRHQLGLLASDSGRALAGGTGSASPCPSAPPPPCHHALHSPCSPALGQPLAPCHAALQPNLAPTEGNARAGNPAHRQGPTAAEIEILLMSEAPLFISPEEQDEKIKEQLLTAALVSQRGGWRPDAVFSNQNQPQFGIGLA